MKATAQYDRPEVELAPGLVIGPMGPDDIPDVARIHVKWFAESGLPGTSLALLGYNFIRDGFYRANLANPYHAVDVARWEGRIIAFVAYVTEPEPAVRWTLLHRPLRIGWAMLAALARRPKAIVSALVNLRYAFGETPSFIDPTEPQCTLIALEPEASSREFFRQTRTRVGPALLDYMGVELVRRGLSSWHAGVAVGNIPVNNFLRRAGLTLLGTAKGQGTELNYYHRTLDPPRG